MLLPHVHWGRYKIKTSIVMVEAQASLHATVCAGEGLVDSSVQLVCE